MTGKKALRLLALSIGLVLLGYWIDTDEPYDNFMTTVKEFIFLTVLMYGFVLMFSTFISWIRKGNRI